MFLNIITPCTRPENLKKIAKSINIPREQYRWIVVFDSDEIPNDVPENCEPYAIKVEGSIMGNGQRNYAIDLVKDGWIYFNDDDVVVHPDLWDSIKYVKENFISFIQKWKSGDVRLSGKNVMLNSIDSHNFIVSIDIVKDLRWVLNRYDADGVFAETLYNRANTKLYIPRVLSIYNSLRM